LSALSGAATVPSSRQQPQEETDMKAIRLFVAAALCVGALAPLGTQAASTKMAMQSCVQTFIERALPPGVRATTPERIDAVSQSSSVAHGRIYHFSLEARQKATGKVLARAECAATRDGEVISYTPTLTLPGLLAAR
jgi:hypothetical protein